MAAGSSPAWHHTAAFDQLSSDYQSVLRIFEVVLRNLKGASAIGPSHALTKDWTEYRRTFKNLHTQSQLNASRLAESLRKHRRNVPSIVGGSLSVSEKETLLSDFQASVQSGLQHAQQLTRVYDELKLSVEAFPTLIRQSISWWKILFTNVANFCHQAAESIKSLSAWVNNELMSLFHLARDIIYRVFGAQCHGVEHSRSKNNLSEKIWTCNNTSPNKVSFDTQTSSTQECHRVPFRDAKETAKTGCRVITAKLRGFETYWEELTVLFDKLNSCVQLSPGMLDTLQLQGTMLLDIEEAYDPAIAALNAFALSKAHSEKREAT